MATHRLENGDFTTPVIMIGLDIIFLFFRGLFDLFLFYGHVVMRSRGLGIELKI